MLNYTIKAAHILQATPSLIDWLLHINTHNRTPRQRHINAIKKQIKEGNWLLTNQGIGISKEGVLLDGQHRVIAIKELDYPPVEILIVTGLERKAQMVVDNHSKRTAKDSIMLFMNRSVTNHLVAMFNLRRNLLTKNDQITLRTLQIDLNDIVDDIQNYEDEILFIETSGIFKLQAAVSAAIFDYSLKHPEKAYQFATQVVTGENLTKNDPAYRLRMLISKNFKYGGGNFVRQSMYLNTVSACIAHATNKQIESLRPSQSWDRLPNPINTVSA